MGRSISRYALIGADIAKQCGEDPIIVNCVAAHHKEVPFESVYGPNIMVADSISASRPGARRETLSAYIKRLEKLEEMRMSRKHMRSKQSRSTDYRRRRFSR